MEGKETPQEVYSIRVVILVNLGEDLDQNCITVRTILRNLMNIGPDLNTNNKDTPD